MSGVDSAAPSTEALTGWDRYWFGEASLVRLGAFRIAIMLVAFWDVVGYSYLAFADAAAVSAGAPARAWRPIYLFEIFGLQPIGMTAAQWVYGVLLVAILCAALGLFARLACVVVAVLAFYWSGLVYSFGKPHHDKVALTFALWALPLAPVGARLSFDHIVRRYRAVRRGAEPDSAIGSGPMAWLPIRLTQWTVAIGYGAAGWSKVLMGGTGWINGYTQQGTVMGHDNVWSAAFAQNLLMCQVSGVATVLGQLTFPLCLVWPRLAWLYVPLLTGMHLVTWQTMDTGPYFGLWGATIAAFVPWQHVPGTLGRWLRGSGALVAGFVGSGLLVATALLVTVLYHTLQWSAFWWVPFALFGLWAIVLYWWWCRAESGRLTVLYDGGCGFCRRAVSVLLGLDWTRRIEPLSLMEQATIEARFPQVDREACVRDMHVVRPDGRFLAGFAAYRWIAWRLPLAAPFAWLLYIPPISTIGARVYRHVADTRTRGGCGDGEVCSIR